MQMNPSTPSLPNVITLDVGGRKFRTTKAVLSTSPYFANLFNRWEDYAEIQADGSLFIDVDPEIFPHLLNYLRRPNTFPLYWTRNDGFDYVLYTRLGAEADYFMLEGLKWWIRRKEYLEAVKVGVENYEHPQVTPEYDDE
ncbi:K-tetra multi-domain protein [Pyrenophora tritici-repentis]|nr:K-tetra multi-domain protein [Pyrenophora tritici-repentis]